MTGRPNRGGPSPSTKAAQSDASRPLATMAWQRGVSSSPRSLAQRPWRSEAMQISMATQGASSSCTRASFAVGKTDRISLGEEEVDDVDLALHHVIMKIVISPRRASSPRHWQITPSHSWGFCALPDAGGRKAAAPTKKLPVHGYRGIREATATALEKCQVRTAHI